MEPVNAPRDGLCVSRTVLSPCKRENAIQAGEEVMVEASQEVASQQMHFIDSVAGEKVEVHTASNPVASVDGTPDVSLGEFFARPTLIRTYNWAENGSIGTLDTFNPWKLFFNNSVIKKKVDNFQYLRCTLHLKVVVNASPFYYGLAMMSYVPLEGWSYSPVRPCTTYGAELVSWSQCPHIKILPSVSAGGDLKLPFFYHKNWLYCNKATDFDKMGTARLHAITPLLNANGVTSQSITLQIYAWAEEVELMGPTIGLALQAGDEYGDGPISRPASALASLSGKLSSIPVIGKFARATEIGASAVSSIAALFGYSNVPVIADVHAFQNSNLPHLASAGIGTAVQKLTIDPKAELSIDPSIHGLYPEEPLEISSIVSRPSYLAGISWSTSNLYDDVLFNMRVNPVLTNQSTETNATRVGMVPMAYLSRFFTYWRGNIKVRFKVVASKFHKGRLRISYDPNGRIDNTTDNHNTCFNTVLDIGSEGDVILDIPYRQGTAWLRTRSTFDQNWTNGSALASDEELDNGLISVRVLTPLTAPVGTSNVYLVMYVEGGEHLEFAVPFSESSDSGPVVSQYAVQAGTEYVGGSMDKVGTEATKIVVGSPTIPHEGRYGQNFGERIVSLRSLLQRSSLAESIVMDNPASNQYAVFRQLFGRMPLYFGFDPAGINTANKLSTGTAPFNFVPIHPLPEILAMFRGYRGSVHHQFNLDGGRYESLDNFFVYRHGNNRSSADRNGACKTTLVAGANIDNRWRFLNDTYNPTGTGGCAVTSQRTNNGLSVSIPDYNRFNFTLVNPNANTLGTGDDESGKNTYGLILKFKPNTSGSQDTSGIVINRFVGIGSDFTPLFFLCSPTVDFYSSLPAAT